MIYDVWQSVRERKKDLVISKSQQSLKQFITSATHAPSAKRGGRSSVKGCTLFTVEPI